MDLKIMQKQWSKKFGIVKSYFSGRVGWVGGWGGWLEKSRVRLSHLPTKLKLKLKLKMSLAKREEKREKRMLEIAVH